MKKIVLVLTASALAVSLMAATTAGAKRTAAPPTLKPDTLIVGLTPPASGFQVGTLKGTTVVNPKGMEIDLAKAIAAKLGLNKIVWYNQSSFAKSYAPGPKPYDLYFGEETITPERSKNVDYSIPYINADQGAMVRKGLTPLPKSIADLKKLTLCAQAGTTGAAYIKAHIKPDQGAVPEHDRDHVPAAESRSSATRRSTTSRSSAPRPRPSPASTARSSAASSRTSSTASSSRRAASCARSSTPCSRA